MHVANSTTRQRGDTLVEVLVAITVFGVVIVGAFSLMNRGVSQMYDSMEKSEVRLLLNRQIETLTYARDQYFLVQSGTAPGSVYDQAAQSLWLQVKNRTPIAAIPSLDSCGSAPQNAFWVTTDANGLLSFQTTITAVTSESFPSPGKGIWMQKIDSAAGAQVPYKDFYIRACWRQNSSPKTQTLSTVVRLYDK